jgi:hypothetical protein
LEKSGRPGDITLLWPPWVSSNGFWEVFMVEVCMSAVSC